LPFWTITRTISCCRWSRSPSMVLKASCTSIACAPNASTISFCSGERKISSTRKASLIVRPPRTLPATAHHCFPHYSTVCKQIVHCPQTHRRAHTQSLHTQSLTSLAPQLHQFSNTPCSRVLGTPYTPCLRELAYTLVRHKTHRTIHTID